MRLCKTKLQQSAVEKHAISRRCLDDFAKYSPLDASFLALGLQIPFIFRPLSAFRPVQYTRECVYFVIQFDAKQF